MKHDLLSVSQMCVQGHILVFESHKCEVRKESSRKLVATAHGTPNNIYILDEDKGKKCCMRQVDQSWIGKK